MLINLRLKQPVHTVTTQLYADLADVIKCTFITHPWSLGSDVNVHLNDRKSFDDRKL